MANNHAKTTGPPWVQKKSTVDVPKENKNPKRTILIDLRGTMENDRNDALI
jgi:hypothetical protein